MDMLLLYILCTVVFTQTSSETCLNTENAGSSQLKKAIDKTTVFYNSLVDISKEAILKFKPCLMNNCSCFFDVLRTDLAPFQNGITRHDLALIRNKGTTYIVFQHKLYRSKECMFPARCSGVEYFIRLLLPKLTNTEFVLNTRDWPQISAQFGVQGPVFSFSKTPEYRDIHFPAWSFWEGGPAIKTYPRGLGRWDVLREALLKESKRWTWETKIEKGFFRGSRTSGERDALVLLSREHPDLVEANYTKNQAWKSPADTLNAEPASEVSLEHHCRYKYLFNLRGVAASFRFKHLFLCGSLVIHFGDEWTEFFYKALKPWVHYIPLSAEATQDEIKLMLLFLQQHDSLAAEIAQRGQEFIRDHLRMQDVKCYWRQLLKKYTKLLTYPVSLDPELQEIR